jgi:arylsulfatase
MDRRGFLQTSGGALAALSLGNLPVPSSPDRPQGKAPNLLFLITDQQRKDTLSVYGNRLVHAPNLNSLAAESAVFQNYYVTQPLCTPSRGSLMTGLYPHSHHSYNNNIVLPESTPVLVQMLKQNQYVSAYFGKWHLGNEVCPQHGFDYWESTEDYYGSKGYTCDRTHSGYADFLIAHGQKPNDARDEFSRNAANAMPKELSKPAYLADVASKFMEQHNSKPWVMYVSFLDPHTPFHSVNDKLYNRADMPVPQTFYDKPDPTELPRDTAIRGVLEKGYEDYQGYIASADAVRDLEARYYGKITLVDEMIGRIRKKLTDLGQAENTIIVFTSDHGEMMGAHKLMFKSVMYQQAIQVPMIVHVPWLKGKPQRITHNVSGVDVVPTLLELMSQPVPAHLQGRTWAPYLQGEEGLPERDVIIEWNGAPWPPKDMKQYAQPLRTIVTPEAWKMTLAPDGYGLLYNLKEDPEERINLFYRKGSLDRIRNLAARIHLWQLATGDTLMPFDEKAREALRQKFVQQGVPNLE